jgi:hypothetical protein
VRRRHARGRQRARGRGSAALTLRLAAALTLLALASAATLAQDAAPVAAPEATAPPMGVQAKLPRAPQGFIWRHFEGAVFLRPEAWNERTALGPVARAGGRMRVFAASPEEFSEEKFFEMGFTLQVVKDSKKLGGADASTVALLYLKPFVDAHAKEDILHADRTTRGGVEYTSLRYRNAPPGMKAIVVHKFVIAIDQQDAVFAFTFESPEESWKESWEKFGSTMLASTSFLRR